ncbi:TlpA disulfide reductase family protein [Inquilinus sp. OTU3971]|uniref:TlpA disulfide reductase family protein n=1 Tax=Inquilinus sp. OTU3971 TaxID=3043855 RepID=UPI00313D6D61
MADLTRRALMTGAATLIPATRAMAADGDAAPVLLSGAGQYTELEPVRTIPDRAIETIDGTIVDLREFRGRVVLLNFWASWCAACIAEMPSLDRLAAVEDERNLKVLPISMDRGGRTSVTAFYRRYRLSHLPVVTDPAEHIGYFRDSNLNGAPFPLRAFPITYLVDRRSRIRGYVPGAVEWESEAARSLLEFLAAT